VSATRLTRVAGALIVLGGVGLLAGWSAPAAVALTAHHAAKVAYGREAWGPSYSATFDLVMCAAWVAFGALCLAGGAA
jgi:hypothetical protein